MFQANVSINQPPYYHCNNCGREGHSASRCFALGRRLVGRISNSKQHCGLWALFVIRSVFEYKCTLVHATQVRLACLHCHLSAPLLQPLHLPTIHVPGFFCCCCCCWHPLPVSACFHKVQSPILPALFLLLGCRRLDVVGLYAVN